MPNPLNFSHQDYDDIIEFCEGCTGTFAIKNYINERIKKFRNDNNDMILQLMEHIEKKHRKISYDPDDANPYYEWEILNFGDNEHPKHIKNPHIEYLYSYLCFLCDHPKTVNKILDVEEHGLPVKEDFSFNTGLNNENLTELCNELVNLSFIEKKSQIFFLKIFTNQPLESIEPVSWLGKYRNGVDMQTLFELIKHLCSWEYKAVRKKTFFCKIDSCFQRPGNKEFGMNNIETNFSRWNKDKGIDNILRNYNSQDKRHLLFKFLQGFPS